MLGDVFFDLVDEATDHGVSIIEEVPHRARLRRPVGFGDSRYQTKAVGRSRVGVVIGGGTREGFLDFDFLVQGNVGHG